MKCVILQPSYVPWRGYFHQVARADLFVFYDDVKYDKNGWRNRNRIKTPNGPLWLTVPVLTKGVESQAILIKDILIDEKQDWTRKHWNSLTAFYGRAPYFDRYAPLLADAFQSRSPYLSDLTIALTISLAQALGIQHTRFMRSSEITGLSGHKTDRLVSLLKQVGASEYISGPSARDYIEPEKFEQAGISLEYMRYNYRPYPQLYPPYEPQVSILDLLFMTGPDALDYILR